jgi:menaquinone-dependent protoporphyrinogen oxidase
MTQRVLVGFSTTRGHAAKVALRIAQRLRASQCEVELHDVAELSQVSLEGYDGIALGASIYMSRHQPRMMEFARQHREVLSGKPSAFFSVNLTASMPYEEHPRQARQCILALEQETGWRPAMFAMLGDALPFTQYGFITRSIMKRGSAREAGSTDTSRDHAPTHWESVAHFAEDFLRMLEASTAQGRPAPLPFPEARLSPH